MRLKKEDGVKVQQAFLLLLKKGDQQYMNIWHIWIYDDLKKKKKARLGPAPDQDLKGSKVYINFSNNKYRTLIGCQKLLNLMCVIILQF